MSLCVLKNNHDSNDPIPEDDDEDRYLDEERMSFFNSLKAVGTSFALVRKSNGDPTFLMYEGLTDAEDSVNDSDKRITRSCTRKILGCNSLSPSVLPKKTDNAAAASASYTKRVRPRRNNEPLVGLAKQHKTTHQDRLNSSKADRVVRRSNNGAQKQIYCKLEALDDQDYGDSNRAYEIWLRNFSESGNGDVQTSSDSDLEVLDKDPECGEWRYSPLADSNDSMEDDDVQYIGERSKPENPQFRKDVEDILRRPFDEKEYETLWLQVNSRKPMQGYRELRGHLKTYSKNAMGKSYLDDYFDLRRKLDALETDLPRKLSVLRGFFYYLKNIANDGIFKPWLDESCLAIVPRTE